MNPASYIPFVNTKTDAGLCKSLYGDSLAIRVALHSIDKTKGLLPSGPKLWIDASVDGIHTKNRADVFQAYLGGFKNCKNVLDLQFQKSPDKNLLAEFVYSVLDKCKDEAPDWISVPQLPMVDGGLRNKINRLMAESTGLWKHDRKFAGRLVLPVVATNQSQLNKKPVRNLKIAMACANLTASGADAVWTADSSLNDQEGSGTFGNRFLQLRKFQEELNSQIPEGTFRIAGPYWGMNLVLWTRGLVDAAAIGLGNSYKYNIPGAKLPQGNIRIALRPLRRWATVSSKLKTWLNQSTSALPLEDPIRADFAALEKELTSDPLTGREQIAAFYRHWFHQFNDLAPSGRAMALYFDLSKAYVLGKTLGKAVGPLPENTAKKPERVAEQLMMQCL